MGDHDEPEPDVSAAIEALIAWSTDLESLDRAAMARVDRDGWGIQHPSPTHDGNW